MISLEIPRREQQARGLLHPEALDTERALQSTTYQILGVMRWYFLLPLGVSP